MITYHDYRATFLTLIAAVFVISGPVVVQAQTSIGETPVYPNVGAPPAGIPVIDEGSVLLCIGMSQANDECGGERPLYENGWLHQTNLPVVIVNGGIDGFDVRRILNNNDAWWSAIDQRLADAGYTAADVQLIWAKNATRSGVASGGSGDVLTERIVLRDALLEIQQQAQDRFPNMRAGFHSARMFGGFCDLNSEPFAYDSINAIEGWTGEPGAIDSAPLWHLGPYIWADGVNPRADGLTWLESDFVADGCHPSQSGIDKFVIHAEIFFNQLTYAPVGGATAPAAPGDVSSTVVDDQRIDLTWLDQSTDEDGFRIERAEGLTGSYAEVATTAADVSSYSDINLAASTEYCYRIRSFNANGDSGATTAVCATTNAAPSPSAPPAPGDVSSTVIDEQSIDLAWVDQSGDEDGFRVERAEGQSGTYSEIATTAANVTTYSDSGLTESTEYCYRVRAFNANGDSAATNAHCATTNAAPAPPPPPPAPPPPSTQGSSGGGAVSGIHLAFLLLLLAIRSRRRFESLAKV